MSNEETRKSIYTQNISNKTNHNELINVNLQNYKKDSKIYVIPGLKEYSESISGKIKECGTTTGTSENCMGDFILSLEDYKQNSQTGESIINKIEKGERIRPYSEMKRRLGYTTEKNYKKQYPNVFLCTDFDNDPIQILNGNDFKSSKKEYKKNWNKLFTLLEPLVNKKLLNKDIIYKPTVVVCGHQHNFQGLFFKFKKVNSILKSKGKHKYGIKNCSVINISSSSKNIYYDVVYTPDDEGKIKYEYVSRGDLLNNFLEIDTFYNEINNESDILTKCNIMFIRHGQALHNLIDIVREKRNYIENENNIKKKREYQAIINRKLNESGFYTKKKGSVLPIRRKTLYKIKPEFVENSLLTTRGVEQAKEIYDTIFNDNVNYSIDNLILVTSPMNRTIETLINSVTPSEEFYELKRRFHIMRNINFGTPMPNGFNNNINELQLRIINNKYQEITDKIKLQKQNKKSITNTFQRTNPAGRIGFGGSKRLKTLRKRKLNKKKTKKNNKK
mgnify:CR=1 FL=1|tara:strand:+ start:631 stop:2139 length:1509 start_codon:yes stop_codon:yes gene_type:complete